MESDHPKRPHHDSKKDLCITFSTRGVLQYVDGIHRALGPS